MDEKLSDERATELVCSLSTDRGREALLYALKKYDKEEARIRTCNFLYRAFDFKKVNPALAEESIRIISEAILDHDPFIEDAYMDDVIGKALQPLR